MDLNIKYIKAVLVVLIVSQIIDQAASITNFANAEETTRARAAELALHRIEKLIILKKIDPTYGTASNQLTLSLNPQESDLPLGTFFRADLSQVPAQDSTQKTVKLYMDANGKTLLHKPIDGGEALTPPIWPAKDPISLMEVAMHCVQAEIIENNRSCTDHPDLPAFNINFLSLVLTQLIDAAGVPSGALAKVQGETIKSIAQIRLNLDGTLAQNQSIEIVPNP